MDDWMSDVKFNWGLGNLHQLVKYTLDKASKRIMISEPLNDILKKRYLLAALPTYIVHNPVDVNLPFIQPTNITLKKKIQIVYAGSIWAMHFDALLLMVDTIKKFNKESEKEYELCIYSKSFFWDNNKDKLDKPGVKYGGFLTYNDLDENLKKGDLLLVTSSFLKEFESFSLSSVQTKLTDYMKVGLPILSVGPPNGACNKFVEKWECGYVWNNTNDDKLVSFLKKITNDNDLYQKYARSAYDVVKNNFTKPIIQQALFEFITKPD